MKYDIKTELFNKSSELFRDMSLPNIENIINFLGTLQNYILLVPGSIKKTSDSSFQISGQNEIVLVTVNSINIYANNSGSGISYGGMKAAPEWFRENNKFYDVTVKVISNDKTKVSSSRYLTKTSKCITNSYVLTDDGLYFMDNYSIRYYDAETVEYLVKNNIDMSSEQNIRSVGMVPDGSYNIDAFNGVEMFEKVLGLYRNPTEMVNGLKL